MRELRIHWQRLVESGTTCPRCSDTGEEVRRAVDTLTAALAPIGITVNLQEEALALPRFMDNPVDSNRILVNDRSLEDWLGGQTGQSQCCDVCGTEECRTVSVDGTVYEAIPQDLVVRAGLFAAQELLAEGSTPCCGPAAPSPPGRELPLAATRPTGTCCS